jgi:photosystem II stability/assembly factor-like uncharacterized protein
MLVLFTGGNLIAQQVHWKLLAPNIIPPKFFSSDGLVLYGAIAAKGKTVLAGWSDLVLSSDEGKSWTKLSAPVDSPDYIYDVDIYDENTFAMITNESGAFYSIDRGNTWIKLSDVFPAVHAIKFAGAPDRFAFIYTNNEFIITTLGGITFSGFVPGMDVAQDIQIAADNSVRFLGFKNTVFGQQAVISTTTDYGASWTVNTTVKDADNYTFITDPQDANRMVIINEDFALLQNDRAEIFLTTDNGVSFQTVYSSPVFFDDYVLSGNSTKGCQDYFVGTASGTLRSQDKGLTWTSIGGPPSAFDSRLIRAVGDSLLYVVDTLGSIWVTDTKGRSSQPIITGDYQLRGTEFPPCDTSAEIFISMTQNLCTNTNIDSLRIIGANASDFSITKQPSYPLVLPDSIGVGFTPSIPGNVDATLVMTFSDGTTYTIDLGTKVKNNPTLSFTSAGITSTVTDTIGGDAVVHINSSSNGLPADAEFTIHFDTTYLIYRGVLDSLGNDHTISRPTPGSARIAMTTSDSSLFALFSFFPVDSACTHVWIDSITEGGNKDKCLVITAEPLQATICFDPADICGRKTLAKFVKNGIVPDLFIKPNPTSANITITTSHEIGDAVIDVIDANGMVRLRASDVDITAGGYVLNTNSLTSGTYELILTSGGMQSSARFVVVK